MSISPLSGATPDPITDRPLVVPKPKTLAAAAYEADRFVRSGGMARQDASTKAWFSLRAAAAQFPSAAKMLWENKGQVAKSFFDSYLHPVRSFQLANESYRTAAKEGRVEASLALLKNHAALVSAWTLPVAAAVGVLPLGAAGPAIASAGVGLGLASVAGILLSLAKNVYDASQAETDAELHAQSEQIVADGVGLGFAAVASVATTGIQGSVRVAKGQTFSGTSLPTPTTFASPEGVPETTDGP